MRADGACRPSGSSACMLPNSSEWSVSSAPSSPNLDRCFAGGEVLFDWSSESSPRRYFAVSYSPLRSASEEVEAVLVIQRDVTDRKEAELALRESEQRFRDYAEIASDWFWESDSEHRFTTFTRSAT